MSKKFGSVLASRLGGYVKSPLGARETTADRRHFIVQMHFLNTAFPEYWTNAPGQQSQLDADQRYRDDIILWDAALESAREDPNFSTSSILMGAEFFNGDPNTVNLIPPGFAFQMPETWGRRTFTMPGFLFHYTQAFDLARGDEIPTRLVLNVAFGASADGAWLGNLEPTFGGFLNWMESNFPDVPISRTFYGRQSRRWVQYVTQLLPIR